MVIFDPLAHVKPYSNNMFSFMEKSGVNVSLIQNDNLVKNKFTKFFYYYYTLFYHLYFTRKRMIFNIPIIPFLDLILVSLAPRDDHLLIVHNSTFGHSYNKFKQYFYEQYIKRFRYFITHSLETKNFINNVNSNAKHKYNILNFSIPFSENDGRMDEREKQIILPDKYFLFCGLVKPYKGVDVLIDAIKHNSKLNHKRFGLILAGRFVEETKYLKNELLSLGSTIEIFDWILTDRFMNYLIENASCLVLPYKNIDNSGVFAQAKYFRVPVISSDIGIFREENVENVFGQLFQNGDSDTLGAILEDLWYNQDRLSKLRKNCEFRSVNSWDDVVDQIQRFVKN